MTNTNIKNCACNTHNKFAPIKGKWKSSIINNLSYGRKRFTDLQRVLDGISHKVLNENLVELENYNLVSKKYFYEYPPRVEYSLTSKGYEYARVLKQIESL